MALKCLGNYDEALKRYAESLRIRRELGDKAGIAWTLDTMGIAQSDSGKHAEAIELYEKALEISRALGHEEGIAGALTSMTRLCQRY